MTSEADAKSFSIHDSMKKKKQMSTADSRGSSAVLGPPPPEAWVRTVLFPQGSVFWSPGIIHNEKKEW